MAKKHKCPPKGAPAWMTTFSDLVTLLLTFFVLLLSFANTDLVKYKEALGSIRDAFGVQFEEPGNFEGRTPSPISLEAPTPRPFQIQRESVKNQDRDKDKAKHEMEAIAQELKEKLKDDEENNVEVAVGDRGIIVRVTGRVFFDLGRASLKKKSYPLLSKLSEVANKYRMDVDVEGHTDDLLIKTRVFKSNWELSAVRATTVVRYFIQKGMGNKKIRALGYADTRPLYPNTNPINRSRNRRVEFVFSKGNWAGETGSEL
jgi:chemotaxis protein MotB